MLALVNDTDYMAQLEHARSDIRAEEDQFPIEDNIILLRSKINVLLVEKQALTRGVEAHRALLSPIRRLAPELLQEIFILCLPTLHNAIMCSREAPLLLGRVCSKWRQIAYSTPKLWSSIHIYIPALILVPHHFKLTPGVVSEWLSRSGNLPLSISMSSTWEHNASIPTKYTLHDYINVIIQFSSRWKSLCLHLHYNWPLIFNLVKKQDVPLLQELSLKGFVPISYRAKIEELSRKIASQTDTMISAPCLRRVSLVPFGREVHKFPLNWANLTALDLRRDLRSYNEVVDVLLRCPNLESCSLTTKEPETGIAITHRRIPLRKLQTLTLLTNVYELDLFHSLDAPLLRHLEFTWRRFAIPLPISRLPYLSSFFPTIINGLEELRLDTRNIKESDVIYILKLLPSLRRLFLLAGSNRRFFAIAQGTLPPDNTFHMDDLTLDMFIPKPKEDNNNNEYQDSAIQLCLCPKLEVFQCTGATFDHITLISFLRSRTLYHDKFPDVAQSRTVGIFFGDGVDTAGPGQPLNKEFKKEIEMLEKETGLIVAFRYKRPTLPNEEKNTFSVYDGCDLDVNNFGQRPSYFGF